MQPPMAAEAYSALDAVQELDSVSYGLLSVRELIYIRRVGSLTGN